jgi:coenzyme Q-binding protein COQ10
MLMSEYSLVFNSPVEQVYAMARNSSLYPEFMPDVKSIEVVERSLDGCRIVIRWTGTIKQLKRDVTWLGEEVWDDKARTCRFSLLKGDYGTYSGVWKFSECQGGTRFDSEVEIQSVVPIADGLAARVLKKNLDSLFSAIKFRLEDVHAV